MKKIFLYLILFVSCVKSYSYDEVFLKECTDLRIIESVTVSFENFDGSSRFLQKFSLHEEELKMIGIWGFDNFINKYPENREYGPGISITFYPNRCFHIYKENTGIGQIKHILGEWKAEGRRLYIRFIAKLIIINETGLNKYEKYRSEYLNDNTFYSIFTIPDYKIAYSNDKAFDWGEIPSRLMAYFDFKNDDKPRSRLLLDPLGIPPGDLREGKGIGDFLFSPFIYDEKYLIDLTDIW